MGALLRPPSLTRLIESLPGDARPSEGLTYSSGGAGAPSYDRIMIIIKAYFAACALLMLPPQVVNLFVYGSFDTYFFLLTLKAEIVVGLLMVLLLPFIWGSDLDHQRSSSAPNGDRRQV